MKLMDIYREFKSDLQMIESELHHTIASEYDLMKQTSVHLLQAGGKRIRPIFVLLAGKSGTYDMERLKCVAVALELIHMGTLVHDDVIDHAETRRGQPTVKSKWDNQLAVYTGDYIFAKALQYVTRLKDPRVHSILSQSMVQMCIGEIEQIRALYQWDQSLKTYLLRIKRKTALLMAISCQLGAIASDADEREIKALYRYGYYVGMAFQITDDVLDFTGTEKQLGKPAGSDLLQGNITLPVLATFQDPHLRHQIIKEFDDGSPNMPRIIDLIHTGGGIDCAKKLANQYLQKARAALEGLTDHNTKDTFFNIARFIEQRTY